MVDVHHRQTQALIHLAMQQLDRFEHNFERLLRMSESQSAAIAAINAEITKLQADTTATLTALQASITDLKAQVAAGATLDPTAIVASLEAIDAQITAALPPAPAPAPAPAPTA